MKNLFDSGNGKELEQRDAEIILTPHPGEAAGLSSGKLLMKFLMIPLKQPEPLLSNATAPGWY